MEVTGRTLTWLLFLPLILPIVYRAMLPYLPFRYSWSLFSMLAGCVVLSYDLVVLFHVHFGDNNFFLFLDWPFAGNWKWKSTSPVGSPLWSTPLVYSPAVLNIVLASNLLGCTQPTFWFGVSLTSTDWWRWRVFCNGKRGVEEVVPEQEGESSKPFTQLSCFFPELVPEMLGIHPSCTCSTYFNFLENSPSWQDVNFDFELSKSIFSVRTFT